MEKDFIDANIDFKMMNYMVRQMTHINFAAIILVDQIAKSDDYDEDVIKTAKDIVKMSDLAYI